MPKKRKNFRSNYNNSRNYDDPAYANFRKEVRKRDGNVCKYPGCKKWASHPSMRYDVTNGITLCKKCHDAIKNNEEVYESFFFKILEWDAIQRIKKKEDEQ